MDSWAFEALKHQNTYSIHVCRSLIYLRLPSSHWFYILLFFFNLIHELGFLYWITYDSFKRYFSYSSSQLCVPLQAWYSDVF